MALTAISGIGPHRPNLIQATVTPAFTAVGPIDATGEKIAFSGRVWFPARTSTKAIRRVCLRWGTVTKSGGSALTISLQDVSLTAGPPMQPDETQDQTVAVANADAGFASNTWYRSGTLSADRTVTFGDLLSVVVEYDGSGRSAPDSVNLSCPNWPPPNRHGAVAALKTASWAATNTIPNVILEMSDGTFGTLLGSFPCSEINMHTIAVNTGTADEYALAFTPATPFGVDGMWAVMTPGTGAADFEAILYQGTSALATVAQDGNLSEFNAARLTEVPFASQDLAAGTLYYASIRPTTTTSINVFSFDVADANHLTCHDEGTAWNFATRLDQGSWAAATTTRRLMAGVRASSLDDGAGGGGGGAQRGNGLGMWRL
jgi:hypothetical protein